jgi:hypothetical protein
MYSSLISAPAYTHLITQPKHEKMHDARGKQKRNFTTEPWIQAIKSSVQYVRCCVYGVAQDSSGFVGMI